MKRLLALSISFFTLLALLLSSIHMVIFNPSYFEKKFTQNNTSEVVGVSESDLYQANQILLEYVVDKRDNMDFNIVVNGFEESYFNQREKDHMVDVKALYVNSVTVRNSAYSVAFFSFMLLFFVYKTKSFNVYRRGLYEALALMGSFIAAIAFYAMIDFDAFWTSFHQVFFTNDLWLLNPFTDRMIMMYTLDFFYGMVFNIFILIALSFIGYSIMLHLDLIKGKLKK